MMTGASAPESNAARKTFVSSGAASGAASDAASGAAPGVVLIGFMGVGKSHVGKALAQLLQLPFVDTDELIERQFGPIAAIFAQRGEKGFRLLERPVVVTTLAAMDEKPCVVALGGGAVTSDDVRAALTRHACVAWLTAPLEVLRTRVRDDGSERPLAVDEDAFAQLYSARQGLYEACATASFINDGSESAEALATRLAEWARVTKPVPGGEG